MSITTPARPPQQPPRSVSARPVSAVLGGLLVALPVVVFALVWQHYAVNVPKWDDHALREYLYRFDQETTFSGKIYQLFKQHNEHRIVYDRMVATLDYWLFGKMSYVHLMVVGNLSLVALLAVFGAVLLRAGKSVVYLVPVALLLFNLSHWENMFWGMAALQNFSVVFWVILTIYLLTYPNRFGLAMVSAVLATLTSGNGLLVWPIGFALLLLQPAISPLPHGRASRRLFSRPLIGWAAGAVVVITLYFIGFEKPAGNPPLRGTATDLLKGWLAFTGSTGEVLPLRSPLRTTTLLGGLMVLATLGLVAWGVLTQWAALTRLVRRMQSSRRLGFGTTRTIPSVMLFFWGCTVFILGTAAIVAWTRTGFGLDLIITSRYKIYSLTLLSVLCVYVVVSLPAYGRWAGLAGGISSLLIAWLSYTAYLDETIWWRHWMLTNQFNATHGTNQPVALVDAVTEKYTTLAPAFYDTSPAVLYEAAPLPIVPVTIAKTPAGFAITQPTMTAQDQRDSRAYVVVRSPKRTYLFPTRQQQNLNKRTYFWPANPFVAGFTATVAPADVDAGRYDVLILTVAPDGQLSLHPTGQTITSAGQTGAALQKNW